MTYLQQYYVTLGEVFKVNKKIPYWKFNLSRLQNLDFGNKKYKRL